MSSRALDILGLDCLKRKFKELSYSEITSVLEECDYDVLEVAHKLQKLEYEKLKKIVEDMRNKYENETLLFGIRSPHILIPPIKQNEKELQARESSDEDLSKNDLGEEEVGKIEEKEPINKKSSKDELLYTKLGLFESDKSDLTETDMDWIKLRILYEVDGANYGFIYADFMYKRLMLFSLFLFRLLKRGNWTLEFVRVISRTTEKCIPYLTPEIPEIRTMDKLASDNVARNGGDLNALRELVETWVKKEFKNLKTKLRDCYITANITELGEKEQREHNPKDAAEEEKNMDSTYDSASEVGLFQQTDDDIEFSDEKPWMVYFATEKELMEERKATLLHLRKAFPSQCGVGVLIDEYANGVLAPLKLKFNRLLNRKQIWTLDEVKVINESAKEAKTLLLVEEQDELVSHMARLDGFIEKYIVKGTAEQVTEDDAADNTEDDAIEKYKGKGIAEQVTEDDAADNTEDDAIEKSKGKGIDEQVTEDDAADDTEDDAADDTDDDADSTAESIVDEAFVVERTREMVEYWVQNSNYLDLDYYQAVMDGRLPRTK